MNHIDAESELYALGMLDDAERARVDEHLASCDACLARVGAAEEAVAALVEATQRPARARAPRWPLAVAAAFAVATFGLAGQAFLLHGELDRDGTLLATLVDGHFEHAQFTTATGKPIAAKVIYDRRGAWYEVLAAGTPAWRVVFVRPDGTRDVAPQRFARRGAASVLSASPSTPVRAIELDDAEGRLVGTARPVLAPERD